MSVAGTECLLSQLNSVSSQSARGKPSIAQKTGSISHFVFGKIYKNVTHKILKYYLGKINNKTVNFVIAFIAFNNAFNNKKRQFNITSYGRNFH